MEHSETGIVPALQEVADMWRTIINWANMRNMSSGVLQNWTSGNLPWGSVSSIDLKMYLLHHLVHICIVLQFLLNYGIEQRMTGQYSATLLAPIAL